MTSRVVIYMLYSRTTTFAIITTVVVVVVIIPVTGHGDKLLLRIEGDLTNTLSCGSAPFRGDRSINTRRKNLLTFEI